MQCFFIWQGGCAYDSSGTAAWVQAVGALVALAVAIGLPEWHSRKARMRNEEAAKIVAQLVVEQVSAMGKILIGEPGERLHRRTNLTATVEALMTFPLERLEKSDAVAAFIELRAVVPKAEATFDRAFKASVGAKPRKAVTATLIGEMRTAMRDCDEAWTRLVQALEPRSRG